MTRRPLTTLAAMLLLAVPLACGDDPAPPLAGYERTPTPALGELTLPAVEPGAGDVSADADAERRFAFQADAGGLLLVYFGYTSCPDVCPTTLSDVRRALDGLGDDAARVDLAMVTIDPEVDTPDILADYVRTFVPDAVALRTVDDGRLRTVAEAFGADYGKTEVDGEAEVFHTASLYAVDAAGDLVLTWPFGTSASDLGADLAQLLEARA